MLQKRSPEGNIDDHIRYHAIQIIEDYRELFKDSSQFADIQQKDFDKLNDIIFRMVKNDTFYYCTLCKVLFSRDNDCPFIHNNKVIKIDSKYLSGLKDKQIELNKMCGYVNQMLFKTHLIEIIRIPTFDQAKECDRIDNTDNQKSDEDCQILEFGFDHTEGLKQILKKDFDVANKQMQAYLLSNIEEKDIPILIDNENMEEFVIELLRTVSHLICCCNLTVDKETALAIKNNALAQQIHFDNLHELPIQIQKKMDTLIKTFEHHVKKYKEKRTR